MSAPARFHRSSDLGAGTIRVTDNPELIAEVRARRRAIERHGPPAHTVSRMVKPAPKVSRFTGWLNRKLGRLS